MTDFDLSRRGALAAMSATAVSITSSASAQTTGVAVSRESTRPDSAVTRHRTAKVDGIDIFYREAGPSGAPVIVLLHGFPTSSRIFRNLIPALSDSFRVIAPDYPGFGQSAVPDPKSFQYGFAKFTELVDGLLAQLAATQYALYVMDYGAPVGFRLALRHPERVTALVVQNGNAYDEGLKEFWKPIKAYWANPSPENRNVLRGGLTFEATKLHYVDGVRDPSRIDPDSWVHDQALLDRPGLSEIQLDIFKDYASNVALYPKFQEFFRTRKPPTLIMWGKNDKIFPADGALAYKRDLPDAELHLLDTGHFALEDKGDEIAAMMRDFLARSLKRRG